MEAMGLRERKKLAAWRAIRTAALTLFEEQGYEAVTVEQIAAAADVSRATFFNYFASKEAVVFDQDPEDRAGWRALMEARPADEPHWDAITGVVLGFVETLRDRMPWQRQLKARSPALAASTQSFGEQFNADLRAWVAARPDGGDELSRSLLVNLAQAASTTAYQSWRDEETFEDFVERLRRCLREARPAGVHAVDDPSTATKSTTEQ